MRRRNPRGLAEWCRAHPWMTFFLVSSALAIPVGIAEALKPAPPPPPSPTPDPFGHLPSPAGRVFVPGVVDI